MNMKNFYLLFTLLLLFSCGTKTEKETTEEVNNSYANVLQEQINVSNKIQQSIAKGDFASFKTDVDSLLAKAGREHNFINSLQVPEDMTGYKNSVLDAISSFQEMGEIGIKFTQLNVNSTEQEYNGLISEFNSLVNEKIPSNIENVTVSKEKK